MIIHSLYSLPGINKSSYNLIKQIENADGRIRYIYPNNINTNIANSTNELIDILSSANDNDTHSFKLNIIKNYWHEAKDSEYIIYNKLAQFSIKEKIEESIGGFPFYGIFIRNSEKFLIKDNMGKYYEVYDDEDFDSSTSLSIQERNPQKETRGMECKNIDIPKLIEYLWILRDDYIKYEKNKEEFYNIYGFEYSDDLFYPPKWEVVINSFNNLTKEDLINRLTEGKHFTGPLLKLHNSEIINTWTIDKLKFYNVWKKEDREKTICRKIFKTFQILFLVLYI